MTEQTLKLAEALGHEVADKRLDILRRIGVQGSISEAARGSGVSYKAAWQAIDALSNLAGTPLLERTVGGTGGGGARLTAAGQQLLVAADLLNKARAQVLSDLAKTQSQGVAGPSRLGALGLRTSMRNQLPCRVQALIKTGPTLQVAMQLPDGTSLYSRITKESAELLGLQAGSEVLALCKATAVKVSKTAVPGKELTTLSGRVTRASRSAVGGEVVIELACGLQVVGFAGPASGLRVGSQAVAHIEASAVVIALSN